MAGAVTPCRNRVSPSIESRGEKKSMLCIALGLVRERPEDMGQVADGFGPPAAAGQPAPDTRPVFVSRREWTFREAARHPSYWLLLGSLGGGSGGHTLFFAPGVAHMQDLGNSGG